MSRILLYLVYQLSHAVGPRTGRRAGAASVARRAYVEYGIATGAVIAVRALLCGHSSAGFVRLVACDRSWDVAALAMQAS